MKTNEIKDEALRRWAEEHIDKKVSEKRSAKTSAQALLELWSEYNEPDWAALRELLELRFLADKRLINRAEVDVAIGDKIGRLPRIEKRGWLYRQPYSMGLEVAVLRDLLWKGNSLEDSAEIGSAPAAQVEPEAPMFPWSY